MVIAVQLLGRLLQANTERLAAARSSSTAVTAACSQKGTQQFIAGTESNKKSPLKCTPKLSMAEVKGVNE